MSLNEPNIGWISVKDYLPPCSPEYSSADIEVSIDVLIKSKESPVRIGYLMIKNTSKKPLRWRGMHLDEGHKGSLGSRLEDLEIEKEVTHWAYISPTTTPYIEPS
jgi:hypothetical protein